MQKRAAQLDPASVAARRRRAESERRVSIRPAPDTMVYLTALLPIAQGVGVYAALKRAADTAVGIGQATSVGQAMADELVRQVTGVGGERAAQPVQLRVVMPASTALAGGNEPGRLDDFGAIPAELAREMTAKALDAGQQVWLKRLYADPGTGELIAMDSAARLFPTSIAEFVGLRDQWCRTLWCDAPIRHYDHIRPHDAGGVTSAENGQGRCAACNYAKQAPGWRASPGSEPGQGHTVTTTTPTGHQHVSAAPAA